MARGLDRVTVSGAAAFDGDALDDADFVICSAAPAMNRCFGHVRDAVDRHCPGHVLSEFGGVHGVDCTLRNGHLVRRLAEAMRERCPTATLQNVTNPLPRMCQIARGVGVETVGFCAVSLAAYDFLDRLHGGPGERFPFARSRERWNITAGGVNHLSWIVEPADLAAKLGDATVPGWEHAQRLGVEAGVPLAVADDHTRDFFPPRPGDAGADHVQHGDAEHRRRLAQNLAAYAAGELAWEQVGSTVPWERPWDYLLARSGRTSAASFHALNLPNAGQIPQLPPGVYVETPAVADAAGVRPDAGRVARGRRRDVPARDRDARPPRAGRAARRPRRRTPGVGVGPDGDGRASRPGRGPGGVVDARRPDAAGRFVGGLAAGEGLVQQQGPEEHAGLVAPGDRGPEVVVKLDHVADQASDLVPRVDEGRVVVRVVSVGLKPHEGVGEPPQVRRDGLAQQRRLHRLGKRAASEAAAGRLHRAVVERAG